MANPLTALDSTSGIQVIERPFYDRARYDGELAAHDCEPITFVPGETVGYRLTNHGAWVSPAFLDRRRDEGVASCYVWAFAEAPDTRSQQVIHLMEIDGPEVLIRTISFHAADLMDRPHSKVQIRNIRMPAEHLRPRVKASCAKLVNPSFSVLSRQTVRLP